ncbi:MAG: sigma-54-dependent Fis family transcriptional regulator [Desulfomonile tiedjei]|nr:sigma-54-dependent Fis family transcriptional regulator [Desulfomonile tiedjei]
MSMSQEARVLVIDDEPFSREYFERILQRTAGEVKAVATGKEGLNAFKESSFDLVILDIRLPDGDGIAFLRQIKEINRLTPVIMVTAYGTVDNAVQAMKIGAFDFLTKPFEEQEKVLITVKNATYQGRLERENLLLRNRLQGRALFPDIIGRSPAMQKVFEVVKKGAEVDSHVLIQGESGTGKELIARAIHAGSLRSRSSFLAVDCGTLPENLLETTLFGYERGAFTGAVKTTKGYFEEADGGTLFLDEIGEASPSLQLRLLRALQEKEIVRVGGTRAYPVDVRVVMATNKDLQAEVVKGSFRKDLFYRINVIRIELPPLWQRREDIPALTAHFIERYTARMKKPRKEIHPKALQRLVNHDWPGNVRELQNVIERLVALKVGDTISERDVMENLTVLGGDDGSDLTAHPYEKAKALFERRYIETLVERFHGDLGRASHYARVHPATLYRKVKQYQIQR